VQHGFPVSRLGTNTVAVRVTDHVLQTHIDSCQVVLAMGQPPVADIGPGRTVETGWPLDFDGTGSSDDTGVSRYAWDFGDGTSGTGPRPRHIYRSASPTNYTVVLTVYDTAEQASAPCTAQVSVVTGTTPKAEAGGPYTAGAGGPPAYFDGSASSDDLDPGIVQGVAKYVWDIDTTVDSDGDGTTSTVASVADRYVIQATHTYSGPPDRPFIARLSVWDAQGLSGSDEYRLVMRPDTASTRADIAVDEALWWLHKNQNRTEGYWNNTTEGNTGYRPAAAAGSPPALSTATTATGPANSTRGAKPPGTPPSPRRSSRWPSTTST